jgi:hypothetical protein
MHMNILDQSARLNYNDQYTYTYRTKSIELESVQNIYENVTNIICHCTIIKELFNRIHFSLEHFFFQTCQNVNVQLKTTPIHHNEQLESKTKVTRMRTGKQKFIFDCWKCVLFLCVNDLPISIVHGLRNR